MSLAKEAWDSVFGPRLPPKDEQADLKDAISAAVTGTKTKRQQEIDSIVKELRRRDSFGYYVPRWPGSPYSGSVKFKSKTAHMDFYSSLRSFAKAPAYTFFQNLGWELAGTGSDIVATSGGESLFEQFLTWGGGLR